MNKKKYLTSAISLALWSTSGYAGLLDYTDPISWNSVNFTALSSGGAMLGGTNDLLFEWDGKVFTSETDYTGAGSVTNVTMATTTLFYASAWTAHEIQMFLPGTYTFDAALGGGNNETGFASMTVAPGQLGMHMLMDWGGNFDMDVVTVFNINTMFGPGVGASTDPTNCYLPGGNCLWDGNNTGPAGVPSGSTIWTLASADGNGDGVAGVGMASGGPFANFNFNFNVGAAGTSKNRHWGGGTGAWGISNWNELGSAPNTVAVPVAGNRVFVRGTISGPETVTYSATSTGALDALEVSSSSGTMTFSQVAGSSLITTDTTVGLGGVFDQSGGTHDTGSLTVNAGGTYKLSGGSVTATAIENDGTVDYTGGDITASVINNNSGGSINISGTGSKIITADINNDAGATVKVTAPTTPCTPAPCFNADVTYVGTVTNSGTWSSDPIEQRFNDLINTASGVMTGVAGDQFTISGDFINNSTQNTLWDTDQVMLRFDGSGAHDFSLAGDNLGNSANGFNDNFAFRELSLEAGVILNLLDGNTGNGGTALYVSTLVLGGGLAQLSSINSIYDIFYRSDLAGNAYLGGQDFALGSGGYLRAVSVSTVPVPAAAWLFGSGLLALVGMGKRKAA